MSAIGPKQTCLVAPHMSAFRGNADTTVCGIPLLRSLFGAKRTSPFATHMSAYDPKRHESAGTNLMATACLFVPLADLEVKLSVTTDSG